MSKFGNRLKSKRMLLGLTQGEFAKKAGVSNVSQSYYEQNRRTPGADYLASIAEMGCDVMYILTGNQGGAADLPSNTEYSGSPEEQTNYVISVVDGALKRIGWTWEEFPPSRRPALVSAAYKYKMDEDDMLWFIETAMLAAGMKVTVLSDQDGLSDEEVQAQLERGQKAQADQKRQQGERNETDS